MGASARGTMACALLALAAGCSDAPPDVDLILRGGTLVDGSGAAATPADVAVHDGVIHAIGSLGSLTAAREIDASGKVVSPGFVDMHSHADLIVLGDRATQERLLAAKLRQGVTTIVVGNCGLGVAPATAEAAAILAQVNGWMTPDGLAPGPLTIGDYLTRLESRGVVRISAMGLAEGQPSAEQLSTMRSAVDLALRDGAFGLSSGLIYPPGMYSATEELVELARRVALSDRLFTAHIRGSSEMLEPATRELIAIGVRSGARVHHSHLEGVGERFWPGVAEVLALEDRAREAGLSISHDVFPYTRAATMMSAIFPPWALAGGVPSLLERLADPDSRARIRRDMEQDRPRWPPWEPGGWPHNLVLAVGWDGIRVASVGPGGPEPWVGRSLEELGREEGRDPFDIVADLMLSQNGRVGQWVDEISGKDERNDVLLSILAHPAAAVVSDAEDYGRGSPHPAHAGAFARALRLNRERSLLPLEELVRRMTSYPASLISLSDRGIVRTGAPADLVVFDALTVGDEADWRAPRQPASGIPWVVLNGVVVVEEGDYVGGLHGTVLRARTSLSPR